MYPDPKNRFSKSSAYVRVHNWIKSKKGKASYCSVDESHPSKYFEWANVSGKYLYDENDWIQLCQSCHKKMDFTEETRAKLKKSHLGQIPGNLRKVSQFDLNGRLIKEYNSILQAAQSLGIWKTSISNALNGRAKTAGGYIWI